MARYRYVGSGPAQILDTPYSFEAYGQLVELPDDLAKRVIVEGRIALLPADDFDTIGHPPRELKHHSSLETHGVPHPDFPDFHNRKTHAWSKKDAYRASLMAEPEAAEEPNAEHE